MLSIETVAASEGRLTIGEDQQQLYTIPGGLPRKTLREWREERGYTQMRLAAEIGVMLATIGNIETGRHRPSLETARAIAGTLGVLIDQIIWPEEIRPYPSKANRKPPKSDPCQAA